MLAEIRDWAGQQFNYHCFRPIVKEKVGRFRGGEAALALSFWPDNAASPRSFFGKEFPTVNRLFAKKLRRGDFCRAFESHIR